MLALEPACFQAPMLWTLGARAPSHDYVPDVPQTGANVLCKMGEQQNFHQVSKELNQRRVVKTTPPLYTSLWCNV